MAYICEVTKCPELASLWSMSAKHDEGKIDLSTPRIIIYTDGACSGNPGPGGWGAIVARIGGMAGTKNWVRELGGAERLTTNNKMELRACIEALKELTVNESPIYIYTDSVYVIKGITRWIWSWSRNNWINSTGEEVSNQDEWKELASQVNGLKFQKAQIHWLYVRGHQGTPGNERCDRIAVAFSKSEDIELYQGMPGNYFFDLAEPPPTEEIPEFKPNGVKKVASGYLSLVGGKVIRHKTWSACEQRVKGQARARFKKVMNPAEELEILKSWGYEPKDVVEE